MQIVSFIFMSRSIRFALSSIAFAIFLLFLVGYTNGSIHKNKLSPFIKPSTQLVKLIAANQEIKPTPIYIKLEIEDFAGVGAQDSAAWQQNMSWHPQWSRGGASGWWGVKGLATAATGGITKEIYIPQNGEYSLWMRYQDYTGKAEPFNVIVNYTGGYSKAEFGRMDVNTQPHPEIRWNYAWDKKNSGLAFSLMVKPQSVCCVKRTVNAIAVFWQKMFNFPRKLLNGLIHCICKLFHSYSCQEVFVLR